MFINKHGVPRSLFKMILYFHNRNPLRRCGIYVLICFLMFFAYLPGEGLQILAKVQLLLFSSASSFWKLVTMDPELHVPLLVGSSLL